MQTYTDVEHICLCSEPQDERPEERTTNRQFHQHSRWRRREAHFTVFNDHHIAIESTALGEKPRRYEFDLTFLGSKPRHTRHVDWSMALLALSLFAAALATGLAAGITGNGMRLALMLGGTVLAFAGAVYRSYDRVVYFSKHGRAPLLVLLNRNPDAGALQDFLADLTGRIRHTRQNSTSRHDFLCAELREHRRLHEQGVLGKKEYERIKRRILKRHGEPAP